MEWIPLSGYENGINLADKPRQLTLAEINYVVAHVPLPPSADSTAAEVSRQGTVEWMIETLKDAYIAPSAIPELIQRIIHQHNKSLIAPGTPVGITAAEAVGATTTQMTLNTFHTSGSSKSASFGIEAMRDLIFARKSPKNESCTIYFTNKTATYEEVLDSRRYIVGSVVSNFVRDTDIDSPDVLSRFWWHDAAPFLLRKEIPNSTKVLRLYLNTTEMFKHRVTIADLAAVLEREVPPSAVAVYGPISDGIIDLYPHPAIISETIKGREKRVIPPDLAELTYLETIVQPDLESIRVKGISGIKKLYPVVSPVWRMVMLERKITEQDITTPSLGDFLNPHLGKAWYLFYNPAIMNSTGLIPENLAALCRLAGLNIIAGTKDRLIVGMPDDRFRTSADEIVLKVENNLFREVPITLILRLEDTIFKEMNIASIKETNTGWVEEVGDKVFVQVPANTVRRINNKIYKRLDNEVLREIDGKLFEQLDPRQMKITEMKPSEYVTGKIVLDKRIIKDEIKRLTAINIATAQNLPEPERRVLIRRPVTVPRTDLMKASEFIIADTDGSNLKELLAIPGIDKKRTTCNNMYTITSTFGIENARAFLIRALNNTITNTGSYVHPANIMFIAEFITSRGEPYGATYTGISRQPGGHLSLATLERAGKVFTQNALHGRKEDIRNVSASVAVGARMAIGTGSFDIAQDIIVNGVVKTVINDDLFTALKDDDATNELIRTRATIPSQSTVATEDLLGGIEALRNLTVGGTFDYTGEDETNLLTLFNPGEIIQENAAIRQTQAGAPSKIVRRVQAKTPPQSGPIVPSELIDVLAQIKIGIPLPENTERIVITPLIAGVAPAQPQRQAVISTGLIPFEELFPPNLDTGIPLELEALLSRYDEPEEQAVDEPETLQPLTIVQELPVEEIPQLPDISGINLGRDQIALRREQVRDLQPIDITALQNAIKK